MTIATWKEEFYPLDARSIKEEDALSHSIRKWKGLRMENLKRHGLWRAWRKIYDDKEELAIDGDTCALCVHYIGDDECKECPLFKYLGRKCDEDEGPYSEFATKAYGDPEPMIAALEKASEVNR